MIELRDCHVQAVLIHSHDFNDLLKKKMEEPEFRKSWQLFRLQ
jgi:hypothetical protein